MHQCIAIATFSGVISSFFSSCKQTVLCAFCAGNDGLICLVSSRDGNVQLKLGISYNPFVCDCTDYAIILAARLFSYSHWMDNANCKEPSNLLGSKVGFA